MINNKFLYSYHNINGDTMINKSIWSDTKINKSYKSLNKNINVDILIIGGGITGVNILYNLKDKDVILVERNKLANAVTRNTTGKLTYFQENTLLNILKKNYNNASLYLKSQIEALSIARKIINDNNIECDFEKTKSYIFTNNVKNINKLEKLKNFFEKNNIKVNNNDIPLVKYKYSISVDDTYLFNPIKYINGLINVIDDNKIYENTKINSIKYKNNKYICKTNSTTILANKVILATHYPYFIFPYLFPIKSSLEKSYIISYKHKINNLSLISIDTPVTSIRNYKDNLIYLTNSKNICTNINDKENFKDLLCKNNISYIWSNIDIITNDYMPYIGYIKKNLIISTGFNTWGMSNSILSGKIVKDLLENKYNEYIKLFNPKRNLFNTNTLKNIYLNLKGYINGMTYNKNINKKKCPHAKGILIYNEIENTYDCPCHGSRFNCNGKCFNGPSNEDININK